MDRISWVRQPIGRAPLNCYLHLSHNDFAAESRHMLLPASFTLKMSVLSFIFLLPVFGGKALPQVSTI